MEGSQFELGAKVRLDPSVQWFKFEHGQVVGHGKVDPRQFVVGVDMMPYPVVIVQQVDSAELDVWAESMTLPCDSL